MAPGRVLGALAFLGAASGARIGERGQAALKTELDPPVPTGANATSLFFGHTGSPAFVSPSAARVPPVSVAAFGLRNFVPSASPSAGPTAAVAPGGHSGHSELRPRSRFQLSAESSDGAEGAEAAEAAVGDDAGDELLFKPPGSTFKYPRFMSDMDSSDEGPMSWFEEDAVTVKDVGEVGTSEFRRFFLDSGVGYISPWHEVPLHTCDTTPAEKWMITEIPKKEKAKLAMCEKEAFNPIRHVEADDGKLLEYPNPLRWNYGFLPQTWEDPGRKHPVLGVFGDNSPLDVIEIGGRVHKPGELTRVRVLGALPMVDEGMLDWKVLAVDRDCPLAGKLVTLEDLQTQFPQTIDEIKEWIKANKSPDVYIGFGGDVICQKEALKVIDEAHENWRHVRRDDFEAKLGLWSHMSGPEEVPSDPPTV